jgi:hypothetical protein
MSSQASTTTAERAWFLVHPKGLVVAREGGRVRLPTEAEVTALGVTADSTHDLGKLGEASAVAAPIDAPPPRRSSSPACASSSAVSPRRPSPPRVAPRR